MTEELEECGGDSSGILFGNKRLRTKNNKTITYLFTPKRVHSNKFFKYMERNFKGQYYRNNREENYGRDYFSIDETLTYLDSPNSGQERVQGDNLTCIDNSLLSKGQNPKEVQCEVPTRNGIQECVTIAQNTNFTNPLLERRCSVSNTFDIPFSHCQFQKSKISQEESCSCYCHTHHNCNNFVPKCKLENMFVMHEHDQDTEYEVIITPALDTDPVEFLRYMKSRYLTKGYEKNTRAPTTTTITTTTTTTTTTTATTVTISVITCSALTVGGSTTHLFLLISSVAMMYSKMYEIK